MLRNNLKTKLSNLIFGGIIGGILGALGGTDNSSKIFRRISLPLFLAGTAWNHLHHWYIFSILLLIPIFSIGYGIPSKDDKGSWLGRSFYALFGHNMPLANIFTRGTIGCLISLVLAPIALLKGDLVVYLIGCLVIIVVFATLSWKDLGGFEFQGKRLLWSEFTPYFVVSIIILLLIYF